MRTARRRPQRRRRRVAVDDLPAEAKTRERLVHAASRLLEDGGYTAASVAAIAGRAGVSAGALYRHYPSKAELFVAVFREASGKELAAMREAAASGGCIERIEAAVATFARRALHRRRLAWALVYEPVDPLVEAERLLHRREYCRLLAGLVRDAIAAGAIPEQSADLTAAALVGACAESLVGPLAPVAGEVVADEAVIANLMRFCRRGIGAPDRASLYVVKQA
jgi:AcrR family transcriptional regulator